MPPISRSNELRVTEARMIDGLGGPPVPDAVLIVGCNGLISYAGPAVGAPQTPDAEVIDLGGRTLLPGFIDTHVHFSIPYGGGLAASLNTDPTVATLTAAATMRGTLHAGITSARDLGGLPAGFRTAVEQGLIEGPRMAVAVRMISHTGGHGDFTLPSGHRHMHGASELADTVDEVRVATRRILRDGADVIKICTTGGMASPTDQPEDEGLQVDEVSAVVYEASVHGGKPVAAHAQGTAGILAALRGGVRSVEHAYGIDQEGIDLAGINGAFVVPTLSTAFLGLDPVRMEPYHYQKKIRWTGITRENIARAIAENVKMALGTDAAMCPHGANLRELEFLVELGMSPMKAIQAGTVNAAELLGKSEQIGALTIGRYGDFVVCDGNPLADIRILGDPSAVLLVAQSGVVRKNQLPPTPATHHLPELAGAAAPTTN